MLSWIKRLFATSETLPEHPPTIDGIQRRSQELEQKMLYGNDVSVAISASTDRANAAPLASSIREADETVFWASVRTAAEKKLGAKLSDSAWSDEKVRERWRQRLNMVK